jgi:hypothetical protein
MALRILPKALYVRTALWRAERGGILPSSQPQRIPPALAFRRAALSLRMLASRLSAARAPDAKPMNISVVLIDSMLWTRFEATSDGYTALVYVRGAQHGDVVVVTASRVIEAMVRESLTAIGTPSMPLIPSEHTYDSWDPLAGFSGNHGARSDWRFEGQGMAQGRKWKSIAIYTHRRNSS